MVQGVNMYLRISMFFLFVCSFAFASDWDNVQKSKTLRYAVSAQFPPFSFVDNKNQLTGFDVEICNELAQRLGLKPAPLTIAFDGIIAGLLAHKYEMVCSSLAITDERKKAVDFSQPYYRSGAQLFVRNESSIENASQMAGKKLGVTLGTTYERWIRKNVPTSILRTYRGDPEMILDMMNGRLEGFVSDKIVGLIAIKKQNAPIKQVGELLYEEHMGLAFQKDSALKNQIDTALSKMQADGSYKKLSEKWVGVDIR